MVQKSMWSGGVTKANIREIPQEFKDVLVTIFINSVKNESTSQMRPQVVDAGAFINASPSSFCITRFFVEKIKQLDNHVAGHTAPLKSTTWSTRYSMLPVFWWKRCLGERESRKHPYQAYEKSVHLGEHKLTHIEKTVTGGGQEMSKELGQQFRGSVFLTQKIVRSGKLSGFSQANTVSIERRDDC